MAQCVARPSNSYRITHSSVTGGRVLVCAVCSASFPWWKHQDYLPLHEEEAVNLEKEDVIAAYEMGVRK